MAFVPIELNEFVQLHIKGNPGDERTDLIARLESALDAFKGGQRCQCGRSIWVIGSAMVGRWACFSCITGEAAPSDDYEIVDACEFT